MSYLPQDLALSASSEALQPFVRLTQSVLAGTAHEFWQQLRTADVQQSLDTYLRFAPCDTFSLASWYRQERWLVIICSHTLSTSCGSCMMHLARLSYLVCSDLRDRMHCVTLGVLSAVRCQL